MATPDFPRSFQFELPLFANKGGPVSPWNEVVKNNKPVEESDRQSRATYDILRKFSEDRLKKDQTKLQTMRNNGQQETVDFKDLQDRIAQQEKAFENGGGGGVQFPYVNYNDYSFPIYKVKRYANGKVPTKAVPCLPYNICSFPSPWFPREGNKQKGFTILEVPTAECEFRPAGPAALESDGAVILYDDKTKMEYDFWQVSTHQDVRGKSTGGGIAGDEILATGSASQFDVAGVGARTPEIDPSGSSRASGLPYLGGLLIPEDLADGIKSKIKHALIFALPQLRYFPKQLQEDPPNWVYPATRTECTNGIANPNALAAGQRILLRDVLHGRGDFADTTSDLIKDESLPPIVRIFLDVLYNYGAYLVDGAGGFSFAAEDIHTANMTEEQAKDLTGLSQLNEKVTPWQAVIETLNHYLCCKLLDGAGLAFAYLDETNGFRPNFNIAEDVPAFYADPCRE
ncbi:hypothetical protein [uncultured Gimesia sp.]|uniref:hypothetical protein n=1 Tax=uncultured Gimesia sp. TaxID=1678688 RepID=UPI00260FD607|nr:hypothetical protein [uncultured Gimesia sp.]